ncbi:MAG: 3-hydroxyacyl-CoA dehydrogenase family protein [Pseudonocardiales bacterium]|nr:3-hydroxyacyl-CoA dehydrogenase family protein [Pseudonocardiales bacterium]
MTASITTVGVVGVGTMGAGIAEVFARSGLDVLAVEVDEHAVSRGRGRLEHSTARALERGKLDETARAELLDRVSFTTRLADLSGVDLVIEAVPERLDLKSRLFTELDGIVRGDVVLASNTSSLSITQLAVQTTRPDKVVGMHFFNPAPVLNLVEVVRTVVTDPQVISDVTALAHALGKTPVVAGDRAGFIANGLLFGYLNHAARMFEERYATREDLDAAMRYGCGYPMGPLALLDLIGLDTAYEILDALYRQSADRLHAPVPVLKQMVTAGLLGRKTGRGFYTYAGQHSSKVVPDAATPSGADSGTQTRPIGTVGVVGTGTMATGIAEVLAKGGHEVIVRGRRGSRTTDAVTAITRSLDKAVDRGKLSAPDRDAALGRISTTTSWDDLAGVDLVVEAVAEELEVKREIFATLDEVCKPGAILATTTSSLPVVECAAATSRPGDVIGMHFFNPAPVMKLIEVVGTIATTAEVVDSARQLARSLGKVPVTCGDRAGFIVNALLFPYLNDAVRMLETHYAAAEDIDTAMKLGAALPMGPFALLDVVGLDVALAIQRSLYREFREPGFAPAPLLEQLVTAGRLGRKAGKGFREYP